MNEIEKLYESAGVKPFRYCYNCVDNNGNKIENSADCPSRHSCPNTCDTPEYEFTAEKELKLIKWFMNNHFSSPRFCAWAVVNNIASYVVFLWNKYTDEEKAEIREILRNE